MMRSLLLATCLAAASAFVPPSAVPVGGAQSAVTMQQRPKAR